MRRIQREFEERWQPHARDAVAAERAELGAILRNVRALAVAGGHVAVLLNRLRLFGVAELLGQGAPVAAWSAGAMALSERVVLFHDNPPQGPGHAEVLDAGLGLCAGIVPLPHARRRLDLGDRVRVALFARRFAPAAALAMEDGARIEWAGRPEGAGTGVRELRAQGDVAPLEGAA